MVMLARTIPQRRTPKRSYICWNWPIAFIAAFLPTWQLCDVLSPQNQKRAHLPCALPKSCPGPACGCVRQPYRFQPRKHRASVGQQRSAHQHTHKMQHCQIRPDRKSLRQNDQNGYGMIYHGNGLLCKFCLTTTRLSRFEPITTFFIHTSYLTLELVFSDRK